MDKKNITIVLAKKENTSFNRYLTPVLGRSIISYPILAAQNSLVGDQIYIFTDSSPVIDHVKNFNGVKILSRNSNEFALEDELKRNIEIEMQEEGFVPDNVLILFANSPCVSSDLINNAIKILDEKPELDSVVSAMRRSEFEPSRIYTLNETGFLNRMGTKVTNDSNVFFLDKRLILVRWESIKKISSSGDLVENLLGTNIFPIIQDEGVFDVDYPWQLPIVERWLRHNNFTDEKTPYNARGIGGESLVKHLIRYDHEIKILISTVPFSDYDITPKKLLEDLPGVTYLINPLGRKFKEEELAEYIKEFDILIAGTEKITQKVLANAKKLRLISRVGIGLDNVDLEEARKRGIRVSYTPEAPSPAVAELTIGHMLNLLRKLPIVDRNMRSGVWQRIMGKRLANQVVGIIGTGRVGKRVLKHLQGFNPKEILVNDIKPDYSFYNLYQAKHVEKNEIYEKCDIITLHIPLTSLTSNLITSKEISVMKKHCYLINTSRGGIINENDIYVALLEKRIGGVALDVFEEEPYAGKLVELENCFISCHMGSMTDDCRVEMELLATQEAIRFIQEQPLLREVPEEEYFNAKLW